MKVDIHTPTDLERKKKEYIKSVKPKLQSMAEKELPSRPSVSRFAVNGWDGVTYENITFIATCRFSISGQRRNEVYHCKYTGKLEVK